jgi:hypothetical protein
MVTAEKISASLFLGLLTRGLIGHAFIRSAGNWTKIFRLSTTPEGRAEGAPARDIKGEDLGYLVF